MDLANRRAVAIAFCALMLLSCDSFPPPGFGLVTPFAWLVDYIHSPLLPVSNIGLALFASYIYLKQNAEWVSLHLSEV